MKSERRHELETNELTKALGRLAVFYHQYGSKILLAVVLIVLVIVFLVNRAASNRAAAQAAVDNLAVARELIDALRSFSPLNAQYPEQKRDNFRMLVADADRALSAVAQGARDPAVLAEALVAHADLNWAMAMYPDLPEATTRPAELTLVEDREKLIKAAEQAYQDVLQAYPNETMATLSANMGLAAIAENRQDWATAEKHYRAIASSDRYAQVFRDEAERRIKDLVMLQQPVLLADRSATATEPAAAVAAPTEPMTAPAIETAATQPTAVELPAPATQPADKTEAAATTQPAAQ